jgi:hypothetical protein
MKYQSKFSRHLHQLINLIEIKERDRGEVSHLAAGEEVADGDARVEEDGNSATLRQTRMARAWGQRGRHSLDLLSLAVDGYSARVNYWDGGDLEEDRNGAGPDYWVGCGRHWRWSVWSIYQSYSCTSDCTLISQRKLHFLSIFRKAYLFSWDRTVCLTISSKPCTWTVNPGDKYLLGISISVPSVP